MKALVTGSAGFVGRHMAAALRERGYDQMYVCDVAGVDSDHKFKCDMLAPGALPTDYDIDLVVHCAYRVGGRQAINNSKENLAYNLMLDATLFRWCERAKPKRLLYYSSSAVYPTPFQTKISPSRLTEDMVYEGGIDNPDADYGFAKLAGERMARNYAASGGVVHVLRPFSGYGNDQSLDYPFPTFVDRAKDGYAPFEVWGDPTSRRDWVHIDDVVGCSLAVLDQDYREPLNICTGRGASFAELARMMMKEAGYEAGIESIPGPEGVHTRVGDPTNMLKVYVPRVTLEEGVRRAFA